MKRGFKTQIYPNNKQETLLKKTVGCNRFAYNWMLNQWNTLRKAGGKPSKYAVRNLFNAFKQQFPWLNEVPAHAVSNSASDKLGDAFRRFFKRQNRYPRFRSKKNSKGIGSFSLSGSEIKYDKEHRRLHLPIIGWIKMAETVRQEYSKLYRITVSGCAGKWFVSFNLEIEDNRQCENQAEVVGCDLGTKERIVCSDGKVYGNPRLSNGFSKKLRMLNKQLSRQKKGGKNWWKTVKQLQRLHYRTACRRNDAIHWMTTKICRKYGIVCLEDLNVKGMVKNHRLARTILDVSFSEIRRQFEYKAQEVRFVDRWFPSSKMCSCCGHKQDMPLSVRTYHCPQCGLLLDRDINAAINIKTFAVSSHGKSKVHCPVTSTLRHLSQGKSLLGGKKTENQTL